MTVPFRVLVVDDEPSLTEAVRRHFARQGLDVVVAHRAEDGIEAHRRQPVDVALIDLALGTASGLTVLRALRGGAAPPECVILTGHGTIATAVEAMRVGAFDYITKPFQLEDLDARIAMARARRANPAKADGPPPPLDDVEREHIAAVLEQMGWHQGRAAEALRISPKTLYRKIRQYGFRRPRRGGNP
jgi:two-component system response regulator RegA